MTIDYLKRMTNAALAREYATHRNVAVLDELKHRDLLATLTYDERIGLALEEKEGSDDQMLLDNLSVKDEWSEAYEAGFVAGKKSGLQEYLKGPSIFEEMKNESILGSNKDNSRRRNSEAQPNGD